MNKQESEKLKDRLESIVLAINSIATECEDLMDLAANSIALAEEEEDKYVPF